MAEKEEEGLPRPPAARPLAKLTLSLMDTFLCIYKTLYFNKARQRNSADRDKGRWVDDHHDYVITPGEEILSRYIVRGRVGKGSFGQVLRAYDKVTDQDVALKIIKSKGPFKRQANTEIDLLVLLREFDPLSERHVVKLEDFFEHRGHPILVFPCLSHNLYELLRNTRFRGVSLDLIHKFARQILEALKYLGEHSIIHCDLKPENLLLCQPKRSAIKVIDFGSSCKVDQKMYSYIQSRFYRSPEILVGAPYTAAIDVWSLGCILVEMHTGEPLFGGADSHDQLFKISRTLGDIPHSLLLRAEKRGKFFIEVAAGGRFELKTPPQYGPKEEGGFLEVTAAKSLREILGVDTGGPHGRRLGEKGHSQAHYEAFLDFIEGMLVLDPELRLSPGDGLQHPFLEGSLWARKAKRADSKPP